MAKTWVEEGGPKRVHLSEVVAGRMYETRYGSVVYAKAPGELYILVPGENSLWKPFGYLSQYVEGGARVDAFLRPLPAGSRVVIEQQGQ